MDVLTIENLNFGYGHGQNFEPFDHKNFKILAMVMDFLIMTMTPRRMPNGQKIVVASPPPPKLLIKHRAEGMFNLSYIVHFYDKIIQFVLRNFKYGFL